MLSARNLIKKSYKVLAITEPIVYNERQVMLTHKNIIMGSGMPYKPRKASPETTPMWIWGCKGIGEGGGVFQAEGKASANALRWEF